MSQPLTIRFATDHSAAKAGMQDLAASVVSNMVKVSGALNTGVMANGGYATAARTLATNVVSDFGKVGAAGLKAANDGKFSAVATAAAMAEAAAATQTGAMASKAGWAVASEAAKSNLAIVRNEVAGTARVLLSSPLFVNTATIVGSFVAIKVGWDLLQASYKAVSETLDDVAKVGSDASKLGVSTTFLQTYLAQAHNLRVEVDDLRKSLEMANSAFTVKLGVGGADARNTSAFATRLREHMNSGNVTKEQVDRYENAQGTEAKYRVALDILNEMVDKSKKLAALDLGELIFPREVLDRIRQGTLDIDRLRATMDDLNNPHLVLLAPDQIERAEDLKRRLEEAQATLEDAGKRWNQFLYEGGEQMKRDAITWSEQMAAGAKAAIGILYELRRLGQEWQQTMAGLGSSKIGAHAGVGTALGPVPGAGVSQKPVPAQADSAADQQALEDAFNTTYPKRDRNTDSGKDKSNPRRTDHPKAKSGSESFDAVETFINGLEKTAAAAKAEAEAFGKSNAEKQVAIALAKLKETADQQGITLTDEQIAKTRAAAEAAATYKDKLADLEQQQQRAAEAARYFGDAIANSLGDAIFEGKKLGDILLSLEKQFGKAALQGLFTGQGVFGGLLGTAPAASQGGNAVGGLAGLISSLFGGFRANGGPMSAGRAYTVGEMGQELFIPNSDGRMVPISRGGGFGGAGGGVQIIDQRTMAAPAPVVRRSAGGNTQIVLRDLQDAMQQRSAYDTAAGRRG